jgi:hypothetical protein
MVKQGQATCGLVDRDLNSGSVRDSGGVVIAVITRGEQSGSTRR